MGRLTEMVEYLNAKPEELGMIKESGVLKYRTIKGQIMTNYNVKEEDKKTRFNYQKGLKGQQGIIWIR